jgi:hypothetical protein
MAKTISQNAANNQAERREIMAQMGRDQAAWREEFTRTYLQIGQFASTIASNADAVTVMMQENITGRGEAVEAVKAAVTSGISTIQQDFVALAADIQDIKRRLERVKDCKDDVVPLLNDVLARLLALQMHMMAQVGAKPEPTPPLTIAPEPAPPDIIPPDTNGEPPPAAELPAA